MATKPKTPKGAGDSVDTGADQSQVGQDTKTDKAAPKGKARGNMNRGESKHSPRRIESIENQAKALEYRKMGLSYAQIADKLGMNSPQAAWNCVDSAMSRVVRESAEQVRGLELERLDAMFIPVYGNALRGDLMAMTGALAIMNRRARLLGLDAPVKQAQTTVAGDDAPAMTPTILMIGGVPEEGEPEVMGDPVVPREPAHQ